MLAEIAPDGASRQRLERQRRRGRASPAEAAPADGAGEVIDIVTPGAGESVTEGTMLEWHEVGDERSPTATRSSRSRPTRSTSSCPRPRAGEITELLVEPRRDGHRRPGHRAHARRRRRSAARPRRAPAEAHAAPRRRDDHDRCHARRARTSPRSRARVAAAEGVDLAAVTGSGPGGRITKADVLAGRQRRHAPQPRPRHRCRSRAARRCSRSTWTRAARSRPRPRSARSPSRRSTARRKQLKDGRPEGLLHAPDRLRDRAGRDRRHAGDGPPLRGARRQAATASTTAP